MNESFSSPACTTTIGVQYVVVYEPGPATAVAPEPTFGGGGSPPPPPPPLSPPPGLNATMKPFDSAVIPTAAYTVLRAMLTPPQDRTGFPAAAEPAAIGRWRSGTPVCESYASRNPFRSTVYAMPLATETGSPQCAPSATGETHRGAPLDAPIDHTYPPSVIGP